MARKLSKQSRDAMENRLKGYRLRANTMSRNSHIAAIEKMAFDVERLLTEIERLERQA